MFMEHNVLALAPRFNTGRKKDATGAFQPGAERFCDYYEVRPSAAIELIDNTAKPRRRADEVLEVLRRRQKDNASLEMVAFFCHGWRTGIQLGFRSPDHPHFGRADKTRWNELVRLLAAGSRKVKVPLYACSTGKDEDGDEPEDSVWSAPGTGRGATRYVGRGVLVNDDRSMIFGDDSFGDLLRDALCCAGSEDCRVLSHFTAGHATQNPDVVIFDGAGRPYGAVGGYTLTRTSRQRAAFRRLLRRDRAGDGKGWGLAWRLPTAAPGDICREITAGMG